MKRILSLPNNRSLVLGEKTLVMGVLNCTPDSFSDGGKYSGVDEAVRSALGMVADGADIIDVGGESTRPGSMPVPSAEEIARVVPVIEGIRKESDVPVSIDTCKADVAAAAIDCGADIINDITALCGDEAMAALAARREVPVILMHMRGTPENMQESPEYSDVLQDVESFLKNTVKRAINAGVGRESIIIDPGFGFGKTFAHNAILLEKLDEISAIGYPVLAGLSRKSMIGHALGLPVEERLEASIALAVMAVLRGAAIVRVHDVKETARAVGMIDAVRAAAAGAGTRGTKS